MRRRLSVILALAATLGVFSAGADAQNIEGRKASIDARIAELQAEISAANDQEGVLTSQLGEVVEELRAAESAVGEAEASLSALEAELVAEQERLEQLTLRLERETQQLLRLQAEYRRAVAILESRVHAIYVEEQPDVLSILVSAESLSDMIDSYELVTRIGLQDQKIAREVETARDRAAAKRRETVRTRRLQEASVAVISARTQEARVVRDRLVANRDTLAAARRLKRSALEGARETRQEYLHEVEALAAQSAQLADAIRDAQRSSGSTATGAPSAAGFIWPVNGTVTSGFGMRWGRMHEGIDIAAPLGAPIWAAAGGTVVYAGWLGGYGNLAVVDHGNGFATAYAHASAILVAVGQNVAQGETVALVGSTGHSTGPHLHFEVRVNGVAVDPLLYL
jgi:murein DD-endopeptidase MepM/ murein hydrolase activator NlpD